MKLSANCDSKLDLLGFGRGNAKLSKEIYTFTLPVGWNCPGAKACLAKVPKEGGKIIDGPSQEYRCYQASAEVRFPGVRAIAWRNDKLLKACKSSAEMTALILRSLPADARIVRIHIGGDFWSEAYFLAWVEVAKQRSATRFYAYTKSLNFWVRHLADIPANLRLTASEGGKFDHLISAYQLKTVRVVFTIEEAFALGLELDHDDSHAYEGEDNFALLIHGSQKANSDAGKAVRVLNGKGSYSAKR